MITHFKTGQILSVFSSIKPQKTRKHPWFRWFTPSKLAWVRSKKSALICQLEGVLVQNGLLGCGKWGSGMHFWNNWDAMIETVCNALLREKAFRWQRKGISLEEKRLFSRITLPLPYTISQPPVSYMIRPSFGPASTLAEWAPNELRKKLGIACCLPAWEIAGPSPQWGQWAMLFRLVSLA